MVKTYLKTFARTFKKHVTRLVSIFLMVLVSVGFSAGIGMAKDSMLQSLHEEYLAKNVSDFIVRGSGEIGDEKVAALKARYGEENVATGGFLEFISDALTLPVNTMPVTVQFSGSGEGVSRVYFTTQSALNKKKIHGTLSQEEIGEGLIPIAVERKTSQLQEYALGTELTATLSVMGRETTYRFIVAQIVESPLHMAVRNDVSTQKRESAEGEYELLESIFYIDADVAFDFMGQSLSYPKNEVYISIPALKSHVLFDRQYENRLKAEKAEIEAIFADELAEENADGTPALGILTLHENFSYESFLQYTSKIEGIGYVMMAVFLLVTLLVVLSTMTRFLDEERSQIACLQTLGYSPMRILSKYLLFALVGTAIGGAGAYFASLGLGYIIFINFRWNYSLPPYSSHFAPLFFLIVTAVILVTTLAATLIAGLRMTRHKPATLLRPKVPKAGGKVIFERFPIVWNRFSFKYKSSLRNVLRFKMRFIMTVFAVMCSTALVLAGLAVLDSALFANIGTTSMIGVAIVVVAFAALLNAVVIYTLTNINISERNRELATLMVLGYHDKEVTGYIYREIYITGSIGIALGLPLGAVMCKLIFMVMNNFGTLAGISWFVWILAAALSLFFIFLVTIMLHRKILRIDMNESLKAIE